MKANRPRSPRPATALALLLAIGACAAPPPAPPAPPPAPVPTPEPAQPAPPAPPPPADWRDAAITSGAWSRESSAGRSVARFGAAGVAPLVTLACDRTTGSIELSRSGSLSGAADAGIPARIQTTSGAYPLLGQMSVPPGAVIIRLPARDPALDAMAFSRGRFALEVAGMETLTLPNRPEIGRVIEDCR